MFASKALHLAGTSIDDVEELAAHWYYPVTRGVLRWGGAGKPEAKRDGHIAALVYCERYITASALTWAMVASRAGEYSSSLLSLTFMGVK